MLADHLTRRADLIGVRLRQNRFGFSGWRLVLQLVELDIRTARQYFGENRSR